MLSRKKYPVEAASDVAGFRAGAGEADAGVDAGAGVAADVAAGPGERPA